MSLIGFFTLQFVQALQKLISEVNQVLLEIHLRVES